MIGEGLCIPLRGRKINSGRVRVDTGIFHDFFHFCNEGFRRNQGDADFITDNNQACTDGYTVLVPRVFRDDDLSSVIDGNHSPDAFARRRRRDNADPFDRSVFEQAVYHYAVYFRKETAFLNIRNRRPVFPLGIGLSGDVDSSRNLFLRKAVDCSKHTCYSNAEAIWR